jgi:CRP-like cAMP-binding protein
MDSKDDRLNALKTMPLLNSLPHGELDAIAGKLKVESYKTGDEIIKQGSTGSSAYLIVEGKCDVRRKSGASSRRINVLTRGDFFGELAIVVPGARSASVVAQEPVTVLVLTAYEFQSALRASKAMAMHLVKVLAERLQQKTDEFVAPK